MHPHFILMCVPTCTLSVSVVIGSLGVHLNTRSEQDRDECRSCAINVWLLTQNHNTFYSCAQLLILNPTKHRFAQLKYCASQINSELWAGLKRLHGCCNQTYITASSGSKNTLTQCIIRNVTRMQLSGKIKKALMSFKQFVLQFLFLISSSVLQAVSQIKHADTHCTVSPASIRVITSAC